MEAVFNPNWINGECTSSLPLRAIHALLTIAESVTASARERRLAAVGVLQALGVLPVPGTRTPRGGSDTSGSAVVSGCATDRLRAPKASAAPAPRAATQPPAVPTVIRSTAATTGAPSASLVSSPSAAASHIPTSGLAPVAAGPISVPASSAPPQSTFFTHFDGIPQSSAAAALVAAAGAPVSLARRQTPELPRAA